MRHPMLVLALSIVATVPAAPAVASPLPHESGVVLSVSSKRHLLRIVEGRHVADASYRGAVATGVSPGARVGFSRSGRRALQLAVDGRVDHVVVYGVVARVGTRLMLRLTDSSLLALPNGRHPRVGAAAHLVIRFAPLGGGGGGGGSVPTTPGTTTTPTAVGCARADCTFDVTGSVTAIDDGSGAVTVAPASGGAALTAQPGTVDTDGVLIGDFVHIAGTQLAASGVYTLTELDELPGCDTPDCTLTFDATVDEIEPGILTVADDEGNEYPIDATPAQIASVDVGSDVHIVATQDPTTGDYHVQTITLLPAPPGGN